MEHKHESDNDGAIKSKLNTAAFFRRFGVKVHA